MFDTKDFFKQLMSILVIYTFKIDFKNKFSNNIKCENQFSDASIETKITFLYNHIYLKSIL